MSINKIAYFIPLYILSSINVWASTIPGTLVDKIIAQVDDYIITQSELETTCQHYLYQGAEETPHMREDILRYLIQEKTRLAQATREGYATVKERELEAQVNQKIKQLIQQAGSEEALVAYFGDSIKSLKHTIRQQIKNSLIMNNVRRSMLKQVTATPQEVKSFFEAQSGGNTPFEPARVIVRQIVKYPTASQSAKDALCAKLLALRTRIQKGETFESLAEAYSEDSGSAHQGGAIGFRKPGELAPEYEAAALSLQPGELSEPVVTRFGCHLIQLIDREENKYNTRHILLQFSVNDLEIDDTKARMEHIRKEILAGRKDFKKAVQEFSEDMTTKSTGGFILNNQGNPKQIVDELPEEIFFAIEPLKQGDISEPVLVTDFDNRQAMKLFWLEEKTDPHPTSLKQDYEKIKQKLIEQKTMQAYQAWLKEAESKVFIKLAPEYQKIMQ